MAYDYKIAKNETTIAQYAEFLNAVAATDTYGLYSTGMTTSYIAGITQSGVSGSFTYSVVAGSANKPITFVSWFDAARFANWLHNGQPSGGQTAATTEDGAYTLLGATSGVSVSKNVGARMWIPSESEWYKAAYYDPAKGGTGYWLHANQSDTLSSNSVGVAGAANFHDGDYTGYPGMALTNVGAYGVNSDSYYGTNDQAGNVWEWNDAIISGTSRGVRGGSWAFIEIVQRSSGRYDFDPTSEDHLIGFRVAGFLSGIQSFRNVNILASDGSQDLLTPANDEVSNLMKYACNMIGVGVGQAVSLGIPNVTSFNGTSGLPVVGRDSDKLTLTFVRRTVGSDPGITYVVQFSNDLGLTDPWAVNPLATESSPTSVEPGFEFITITDHAAAPAGKRFVRLSVTTN